MKRTSKLIALLLCAGLRGPGWTATVSGPIGEAPLPAGARFLGALDTHLDQVAPLLGVETSALATAHGLADTPSAATEYLARASLATPPQALERSPEAEAARFLTAALADPNELARAAQGLRDRAGEPGRAAAEKLENLGGRASTFEPLARLNQDLSQARDGNDVEIHLTRFFSGLPDIIKNNLSPLGRETPPDSVETLVSLAERRFGSGVSRAAVLSGPTSPAPESIPDDSELHNRVALSPLTNPERERVVVELFHRAGAAPQEVQFQDVGEGRHNIYVVKKGRTDRVVVVGGHHDKVRQGAGTIDNWTGATMVINLYQAMKDLDTEATYIFIAFAREEEGLLGSEAFVEKLRQEGTNVNAMVNLDTLAVDGTFSWKNNSTKSLLKMIRQVADALRLALAEIFLSGGDADSTSFRRAGMPAITVFGASNDVIWDIIHSARDTIAAFSLPHYKNAYELVLGLLKRLDREPLPRGA